MGKWFQFRGKNKRLFGITKLDLVIASHYKRHGPMLNPEVLAQCPICKKLDKISDHRVFFFECSCGDPFFCHLQNQEKNFEKYPTGKWTGGGYLFR